MSGVRRALRPGEAASAPAQKWPSAAREVDARGLAAVRAAGQLAIRDFHRALKEVEAGDGWGPSKVSPREAVVLLRQANASIQAILDAVPQGCRLPASALSDIDSIFLQLTLELPLGTKQVEPSFSSEQHPLGENFIDLMAPDRDADGRRLDPYANNNLNRPVYLKLKAQVDSLHEAFDAKKSFAR